MFSLSVLAPTTGSAKEAPKGHGGQQRTSTLHRDGTASSRPPAQKSPWCRLTLIQAVFGTGQFDIGSVYVQMTEGWYLHPYFASACLTCAANFTGYYRVQ